MILEIKNLTYQIGTRELFEDTNLLVPRGAKVGVIGPNGCGKSTFFKLLTGEIKPDGGSVIWVKGVRYASVNQEIDNLDMSVLDFILSADKELLELNKQLEIEHDAMKIADISERIHHIDGYTAEARAAEILSGLGFCNSDIKKPLKEFSGGWQMRVALAAALFAPSECLMLDEPTNHLDLETAIWLENELKKSQKTLLLISHEKNFLNSVCDEIVYVGNGQLQLYSGNYNTFLSTRSEQKLTLQRTRENVEKKRDHIQSFVNRFRATASKASQVQSRIKALDKIEEVPPPPPDYEVKFSFPAPFPVIDRRLITLEKTSVGYGDHIVLHDLKINIDAGERIGLLGKNGNGKTTLAKLIAGELQPKAGGITRAKNLNIAYFSQQQADQLNYKLTPLEIMHEAKNSLTESEYRAFLARFGLTKDRSKTLIQNLSGGEKTRLLFALNALSSPHLMLLDEPTNHLDIEAREALSDALSKYTGAIVVVSHDFNFLKNVGDIFYIVANSVCEKFDGTLNDYRKWLLTNEKVAEAVKCKPTSSDAQVKDKKLLQKRRQITIIEEQINAKTYEKKQLEDMIQINFDNDVFGKLQKLESDLKALEEKWLSLQ